LKYYGKYSVDKRIYLYGNGNKTDRIPDSFVGYLFRVVVHSKQDVPEAGGLGSIEWLTRQYGRAYAEANITPYASGFG